MSIVWNKEDDKRLEAMKDMNKDGFLQTVPDDYEDMIFHINFKVKDPAKANLFLADLWTTVAEEVCGISVTGIGFDRNSENVSEAQKYLRKAYELLNQS